MFEPIIITSSNPDMSGAYVALRVSPLDEYVHEVVVGFVHPDAGQVVTYRDFARHDVVGQHAAIVQEAAALVDLGYDQDGSIAAWADSLKVA